MLVDFVSANKLPWIVVWLDWQLYAYWPSLLVSLMFFIGHYWLTMPHHSFSGLSLAIFIGFCAWAVSCAVRYGYAVG